MSVKGVLLAEGTVLLLKNERDEWELPGGKLELGEEPGECAEREILEETGLIVAAEWPLLPYVYLVANKIPVLIVPYLCLCDSFAAIEVSEEHKEFGIFAIAEIGKINLPVGYRNTIEMASRWPIEGKLSQVLTAN